MSEGAPRTSETDQNLEKLSLAEYGVADTREKKEAAQALGDRIYANSELKPAGETVEGRTPFEKWIMSSSTRVFTESVDGELLAAIAVIRDSEIGLPMDEIYAKELKGQFRDEGKSIAEVSQYAADPDRVKECLTEKKINKGDIPSEHLLDIVVRYALEQKLDYLCVVCSQGHANFYQSVGFVPVGEPKYYKKVNKLAFPLALDVASLRARSGVPPEQREKLSRRMERALNASVDAALVR